jgi:hypothetical protein
MFKKITQRIRIYKELHKPAPEFIKPINDTFRMHWEDASLEDRRAVVDNYNKYYCKEDEKLTMERANQAFTGSRWDTIKYTWGVKPC